METGTNATAGIAVLVILMAMACSWMCRGLLLRTLRDRHPDQFAELGQPTNRHLGSFLPRHQEMQIRFWKYLWGGEVSLTGDKLASALSWILRVSDVSLAAGVLALLWAVGSSRL
jgi:hypothetical protein